MSVDPEKQTPNGINGSDGANGAFKHEDMLDRIRTAGSVNIPPELFEQMFLAPQTRVKGDLRQTFGNPTGIAIAGFLLCTTPLSMVLLGWQGAGGLGAAHVGTFFFFGGVLMTVGGVLEWIMGNTFPSTVFTTFGSFWLTYGATLVPWYNASGAYVTEKYTSGLENPQFYNTFSFFLLSMALLSTIYCIASIRTNIAFFLIFLLLIPMFSCLSAAFFAIGHGKAGIATTYQHVGAGLLLAVTLIGWWIFIALMLLSVDFPYLLPLGDLSTIVKGYNDKQKAKNN